MPSYKTENNLKIQQHKYLKAGKSFLPALPDFPEAFVRRFSKLLLLTSVGTVLTASPGWAAPLTPSGVTVTVPSGTNNGTRNGTSASTAYVDDILLNSITYPGANNTSATFQGTDALTAVQAVRVLGTENQRSGVNAEFGDSDTGSDSNPNPFVSAGILSEGATLPNATRESNTPSIQNPSIQASFNTLSLSQGVDGEGPEYTYDIIFQRGIIDNNLGGDLVPEINFFERGVNSSFSVRAITGGTIDNPTVTTTSVAFAPSNMRSTGIYIDTIEIGEGQQLGAVGVDLTDFGVGANPVYGIRFTSSGTPPEDGADMYGQFLTAENTNQFRNVPRALVPFNFSPGLGILVLGAWAAIAQLKRKVQKKGVLRSLD